MKPFLFCAFMLLTSFALWADPVATKLSISVSGRNVAIQVMIDNQSYICQDNCLSVNNLPQGYHTLKLFRTRKDRWNSAGTGNLVYETTIFLKPLYHVDIVVNLFGKALVDEQPLANSGYPDEDEGNNGNLPFPGQGASGSFNNNPPPPPQPMSDDIFAVAKESIRKEPLDNTKVVLARQIIDHNYFTAAQVKEMAKVFTFDEAKLAFAENAYAKTVDQGNYFIVSDVFTFGKSKEDLANYISNYK